MRTLIVVGDVPSICRAVDDDLADVAVCRNAGQDTERECSERKRACAELHAAELKWTGRRSVRREESERQILWWSLQTRQDPLRSFRQYPRGDYSAERGKKKDKKMNRGASRRVHLYTFGKHATLGHCPHEPTKRFHTNFEP